MRRRDKIFIIIKKKFNKPDVLLTKLSRLFRISNKTHLFQKYIQRILFQQVNYKKGVGGRGEFSIYYWNNSSRKQSYRLKKIIIFLTFACFPPTNIDVSSKCSGNDSTRLRRSWTARLVSKSSSSRP